MQIDLHPVDHPSLALAVTLGEVSRVTACSVLPTETVDHHAPVAGVDHDVDVRERTHYRVREVEMSNRRTLRDDPPNAECIVFRRDPNQQGLDDDTCLQLAAPVVEHAVEMPVRDRHLTGLDGSSQEADDPVGPAEHSNARKVVVGQHHGGSVTQEFGRQTVACRGDERRMITWCEPHNRLPPRCATQKTRRALQPSRRLRDQPPTVRSGGGTRAAAHPIPAAPARRERPNPPVRCSSRRPSRSRRIRETTETTMERVGRDS